MSPDIGDTCRRHLDYMRWADEIALGAVAQYMPGSLTTLQHIYLAEQVWLARIRGNPTARVDLKDAPGEIAELQRLWPGLHLEWQDMAAAAGEWSDPVNYRLNSGVEGISPLWQVVLHVANHGSYHRGQVSAMLRGAGFAPPATDLLIYYRTAGKG